MKSLEGAVWKPHRHLEGELVVFRRDGASEPVARLSAGGKWAWRREWRLVERDRPEAWGWFDGRPYLDPATGALSLGFRREQRYAAGGGAAAAAAAAAPADVLAALGGGGGAAAGAALLPIGVEHLQTAYSLPTMFIKPSSS